MLVRPSVRELIGTKSGKTVSGEVTALTEYPVISTRETETQVVLQDGQTIVIGGLLKDRISKVTFKTPFLGDIPILGWLFRRETLQTEKVDLLIFLTASSVPAEGSPLVLTNVNSLARGPALVSPSSALLTDASVVTPADLKSVTPEAPAEAVAPAVNQPAVVPVVVVVNTPESEGEPALVPVVVETPPASAPRCRLSGRMPPTRRRIRPCKPACTTMACIFSRWEVTGAAPCWCSITNTPMSTSFTPTAQPP